MQVQQVWFTAFQKPRLHHGTLQEVISVKLIGEDLAGKVRIGDCAKVFGCTELTPISSAWAIATIQVITADDTHSVSLPS